LANRARLQKQSKHPGCQESAQAHKRLSRSLLTGNRSGEEKPASSDPRNPKAHSNRPLKRIPSIATHPPHAKLSLGTAVILATPESQ